MTAKIPPGPRSASLLPALVAVRGCAPRSHRTGPPTPAQATKPAPRRQAPAKPRIVRPHNRAVPILMYHVVGTAPPDAPYPGLYVRRADFAGQLAWLRAHGYHEDFTNVRPLLARRHWPAVLNLAVRNLLDGKLTTPQIKLMIRQGWEIDAHAINHVVAAVRAAGFFGATIEGLGPASPRHGLLTLPRIRVDGSDGVSGLAAKLAGYGEV